MDTAALVDSAKYIAPIVSAIAAWWIAARKQKDSATHYEFRWLEQTRKEAQAMLSDRIEELKEELDSVRVRCDRLENEKDALEGKVQSLCMALNKREALINALKARLTAQEREFHELKRKLAKE